MYLGRGDEWLADEIEKPLDVAKAQQWLDNNPDIYSTPGIRVGDWEGVFDEDPSLAKYRVTLVAYSPQEEIAKDLENPLDQITDKFEDKGFVAHINYSPETARPSLVDRPVWRGRGGDFVFMIEIHDWHTSDMEYRMVKDMRHAVEQFASHWHEMRNV